MQNESPRLSWKVALAGIVACVLAVGSARAEEMPTIEGQIFIRTTGGETIKLSLVDVLLFDDKTISEHLDRKRTKALPLEEYIGPLEKAAREASEKAEKIWEAAGRNYDEGTDSRNKKGVWRRLHAKLVYLHSAFYILPGLPESLQINKTDADGKFSFKVPSGSYVLVANSSRQAGKETEFYRWMVKAKLGKKVMLANDNLSSSISAESLINAPDEDLIPYEDEMPSIENIAAFVEKDRSERYVRPAAEATAETSRAAQRKAIELYPDLGVADSPLNKEFVARVKIYRIEKKEFFSEADWPVRLAKECSEALAAKPAPK